MQALIFLHKRIKWNVSAQRFHCVTWVAGSNAKADFNRFTVTAASPTSTQVGILQLERTISLFFSLAVATDK